KLGRMTLQVTERVVATARHVTSYLEAGPADGVPLILVHGWPELAISWRHQLPVFAALGYRVIAPDMRGYGRSSAYDRFEDYSMEECVRDLLELLTALGRDQAIWVGHDVGAAVVWALASHHPEACIAVANLCVPYLPGGFTIASVVPLVNREVYPQDRFPQGQWAYWNYHLEAHDTVTAALNADIEHSLRLIFRRGDPAHFGGVSPAGLVKAPAGWQPLLDATRGLERDEAVLDEAAYWAFASNFKRHGFAGANKYYHNQELNAEYAGRAVRNGRLEMPVCFIHALYDMSCATMSSDLAQPMREYCADLQEYVVEAGHWVQQEKPVEVNAALAQWLGSHASQTWRVKSV
ncbi:MAG TPA: alpha/beta hydrolase, partial [Ktedonobacterales bacterium]|nr:alpha/beta hydrolase [Ktedonobacterales bacterium]